MDESHSLPFSTQTFRSMPPWYLPLMLTVVLLTTVAMMLWTRHDLASHPRPEVTASQDATAESNGTAPLAAASKVFRDGRDLRDWDWAADLKDRSLPFRTGRDMNSNGPDEVSLTIVDRNIAQTAVRGATGTCYAARLVVVLPDRPYVPVFAKRHVDPAESCRASTFDKTDFEGIRRN